MTDLALILLAGIGAGMINAVVGSGTLITFPALITMGYPPITANVSNNLGLVPGAVSGTWGYRAELRGQGQLALRLAPFSFVGAIVGAILLLLLSAETFERVVPVLIALAIVLVIVQPRLQKLLARKRRGDDLPFRISRGQWVALMAGALFAGVYGGYFGAAQGIILIGIIASLLPESLQRANAMKNLLSGIVNAVAGVVFCVIAWDQIDWVVVVLIAVGSTIGGFLGAHYGRRLPPWALRSAIVVVGTIAIVRLTLA